MKETTHIEEDAVGLASLSAGDPERLAAFAHASSCPPCARALRDGEHLLTALAAGAPDPTPAARTLAAAARPILGKLAAGLVPTRLLLVILLSLGTVLVVLARHRATDVMAFVQSLALVTVALACLRLLRVLGAATVGLAVGASALGAALAWRDGPLHASHGVVCLVTETAVAIVALAIVVRVFSRRRPANPLPSVVVAAAAGALVGQAALRLTCPAGTTGIHVLVFHGGGVMVAVLAALPAGRLLAAHAHRGLPGNVAPRQSRRHWWRSARPD